MPIPSIIVFKSLREEWAVSGDICSKIEAFTSHAWIYKEEEDKCGTHKDAEKMVGEDNQLLNQKLI